ncbi:MAG: NUDIX hydrolase [Xanthomonadales bacterium]|nr:NUDIX hydrolase [Gammaproteobacteria bacterium]NNE06288.1 NUDIX hydrolase [Xanthomonadales bacterium]NNL94045.1 NUDIX hydrolase [Xanthomonadales bacterium]
MPDYKKLYSGRYLGLVERERWEYTTRVNASAVAVLIPLTQQGELLLVEQFRVPVNAVVTELPAGLVGDLDDPEEPLVTAAYRELEEETGFRAEKLDILLTCPSSAGMSDELVTFVLARQLHQTGPGGGDDSEEITVHRVPLGEVDEWLAGRLAMGHQVDPKIYTALYWLGRLNSGQQAIPTPSD